MSETPEWAASLQTTMTTIRESQIRTEEHVKTLRRDVDSKVHISEVNKILQDVNEIKATQKKTVWALVMASIGFLGFVAKEAFKVVFNQ